MKNITILFVFILLITGKIYSQNENPFFIEPFGKAIAKAKKEKKFTFIDFYTVWCGGCKAYDKFVFSKPEIKAFLKDKFIALSVDAEKGEGIELSKKYEVLSYPQIIIAQPDGKEIDRITGFDSKYSENSQEFIKKVNSILDGTSTLMSLENDIHKKPADLQLKEKLIQEYIKRDQYSKVTSYAKELIQAKDSSIKYKGKFYYCYAVIEDKEIKDPQPMVNFLSKKTSFSKDYAGEGYSLILNYYIRKNDNKNIDLYYQKVIAADSSDWYYKRKYAKFLFDNNMKITRAQQIAEEYYKTPDLGDHYQPLLMAYSLANRNDIEKGMKIYDEWMKKTSDWSMDDKQWAYYYYADFANKHNVRLDKALEYAKELSDYNKNQDIERNILLANLLFKNNQTKAAIDILKTSLEYVQAKSHYSEINNLINQYESKK
jgi:thiol-disulfide isomerase/thioredoxin